MSLIPTLQSISLLFTLPFFILLVSWFAQYDVQLFNMSYLEMWIFAFISFLIAFVLFYHANNLKIARGLQLKQLESVGLSVLKVSTIVFAVLLSFGIYLFSATSFYL